MSKDTENKHGGVSAELAIAKREKKENEAKIEEEKVSFAEQLKAGMGEEMKKVLATVPEECTKGKKPNKLKLFLQRLARTWQ